MNLPFPPFEPDRSIYTGGTVLTNVVPVADGWGPLPDLTEVSTALPDTCLGAWYVRATNGAYRVFAGTATKIYEYNSGTLGWDDVSRASGGDYDVPDGEEWSAAPFGDYLVLVNYNDDPQFIDVNSGTEFAALPGSPPKAKFVGVAGDYLVLGHIEDAANRIMTSGVNDAGFWTVGERGCDFQDFPTGDEVMGIISAEKGAIIAQRTRFRTMTILPSGQFSFRTDEVNASRGVISPLSLAQIGPGRFVYYSPDGFFMGIEGTPIGQNRVDRWFDAEVDRSLLHLIKAMVDPYQKIVWFKAPRTEQDMFLLGYHWGLDRWCYADSNVTAMAALVTPSITIDGLDTLFDTIDDIDIGPDSRLLSGGAPTMAIFDTDNKLCYLSGNPRAATLQTVDAELTPGRRTFVGEVQLAGDVPSYTIQLISSDKFGGTRTTGTAVSPYSRTGVCHFRNEARFHAFKVSIPAGTMWTQALGITNGVFTPAGRQ